MVAARDARQPAAEGAGKMIFLVGVGERVSSIMATNRATRWIVAIDGCSQDWTRKTLEEAGCHRFAHVWASDLGLEIGRTPATAENSNKIAAAAHAALAV